jgi:15-cis-phytoene synthase
METAALAHDAMARGSVSFTLAGRLLPARVRDDAAVLYAWCRRADDAVDDTAPSQQRARVAVLRAELDAVYSGRRLDDAILIAFREVVERRGIPSRDPAELLDGMEMDAEGVLYRDLSDLLVYCHRVAGTVGLMMCRVMGVRAGPDVARHAADLGIAMQLTNVCRDVAEDWERGRLYLPDAMLDAAGAPGLRSCLGGPLPRGARAPIATVVRKLLEQADGYYRSGDAGLAALSWRCSLAVRVARLVYAEIGNLIALVDFDPLAGRAVVPLARKIQLVVRATTDIAKLRIRGPM